MPTQRINAAVSKLKAAIRDGDSTIYRVRQQERTYPGPNAYRHALSEARAKATADIRAARQGIRDAIAQERATLSRQTGPKADNPAERSLYATRAAGIAAAGPKALYAYVKAELAAGNKVAAQEALLIGRGQIESIADAMEYTAMTRAAEDDSSANARAALAGLDAYEAHLENLDAWSMPTIMNALGEGDPDTPPDHIREDWSTRVTAWQEGAAEKAAGATEKVLAGYADAAAGRVPEPYAVEAQDDGVPDADDGGEGDATAEGGEGE